MTVECARFVGRRRSEATLRRIAANAHRPLAWTEGCGHWFERLNKCTPIQRYAHDCTHRLPISRCEKGARRSASARARCHNEEMPTDLPHLPCKVCCLREGGKTSLPFRRLAPPGLNSVQPSTVSRGQPDVEPHHQRLNLRYLCCTYCATQRL